MEDDEETAALLAELRAISMQSASSSRFRHENDADDNDDDDDDDVVVGKNQGAPPLNVTDIPNDIRIPNMAAEAADAIPVPTVSQSDTMTISLDEGDHGVAVGGGGGTSSSSHNSYRSTTTTPSSSSTLSPTKKNSIHLTLMQRHSPQILRRKSLSAPSSPGVHERIPSTMTDDTATMNENNQEAAGMIMEPPIVPSLSQNTGTAFGASSHSYTDSLRSAPSDERSLSPVKRTSRGATVTEKAAVSATLSSASVSSVPLPPWKRRPAAPPGPIPATNDAAVDATDALTIPTTAVTVGNLQHNNPTIPPVSSTSTSSFTYQGERGGAAEDEELLALLRGISSASSSSRRFDDENQSSDAPMTTEPVATTAPVTKHQVIPPWKKKRPVTSNTITKAQRPAAPAPAPSTIPEEEHVVVQVPTIAVSAVNEVAVVESLTNTEPILSNVIRSGGLSSEVISQPYQGERGGVAEDAELLALLRGVASSDRFQENDDDIGVNVTMTRTTHHPTTVTSSRSAVPSMSRDPTTTTMSEAPPPLSDEDRIALEDIPAALSDKNWKVRCQAYDTLSYLLREHVRNNVSGNNVSINSDVILPGLDDRIPTFVEDTNAGALDKALELCLLFAEHCTGAGHADIARRIVSSMIQKNCFSSRPTTLKLSNALTLKLMEVGVEGTASVHAIVETLLTEGLASKKPKVIQASTLLILDATYHFGAVSLPLVTVTNAAPKMLSHSNATVRDCCIKVLAEVCRTFGGSKAPIQNVVDGMKKAQLSELEAQLTEQPEATPIRTGLRSQTQQPSGGANATTSKADAMATLQANAKELEAQRYAARSAVDIIAAIDKTDYSEQIVLSKWSEKVAALDKVLECGGEKPYKLMPPSSHVNYGPLIAEMKKLLAHTHFVVCSRAIQVLSMLALGVGEKLYPHLRPTLTPLLQLSKDKKLTTEVSNGLDALFGTVLSFESLLENDDAVPSMVNEKIQKNALARATALTYLQRCVDRQMSAGPKGVLSASTAASIATLMCNKIDDSDATVRKVALNVLESLLRPSDETDKSIALNVNKVIEQLRSSNPRAYKTLTATTAMTESKECVPSSSGSSAAKAVPVETATAPPMRIRSAAPAKRPPSPAPTRIENRSIPSTEDTPGTTVGAVSDDRSPIPRLEEAMIHVTRLAIPLWDSSEDDGGILAGLKGTTSLTYVPLVSKSLRC